MRSTIGKAEVACRIVSGAAGLTGLWTAGLSIVSLITNYGPLTWLTPAWALSFVRFSLLSSLLAVGFAVLGLAASIVVRRPLRGYAIVIMVGVLSFLGLAGLVVLAAP